MVKNNEYCHNFINNIVLEEMGYESFIASAIIKYLKKRF
jgi:hypothetical protein